MIRLITPWRVGCVVSEHRERLSPTGDMLHGIVNGSLALSVDAKEGRHTHHGLEQDWGTASRL